MSRTLFGQSLSDSEQRDPCEIVQTHMLSWAFSDHICRKYQQAIYEVHMVHRASWFHVRVRLETK